jgi:eukaryotic-like serine/threonine-protein kinase
MTSPTLGRSGRGVAAVTEHESSSTRLRVLPPTAKISAILEIMSHLGVDLEARARAQLGKTLKDKYLLEEVLGVGGMAAVYAARHRNGNRVALKLLYPELSISADVLARFVREGYVANRVNHPGAVRVLDDDRTEDGGFFLVMELLEGEPIDAIWERAGKVDAAEVMSWMDQLLDVLAAAHSQGVVHRDIKPENLFLTHEGTIKVLDFGIARMQDPGTKATQTGRPFGTPAFMSPEQALGRARDIEARSDLFAVGATMFSLLTGRTVHEAETASEMLVYAATRPAPSILTVAPDMPEALAAVVDRAVAFDRDDRWEDARAMQTAVREAYASAYGKPMALRTLSGLGTSSGKSADASGGTQKSRLRSEAETAAPGDLTARLPSRELLMTAPPTITVARMGSGSRRGVVAGGGVVVAIMVAALFAGRTLLLQHPPLANAAPSASTLPVLQARADPPMPSSVVGPPEPPTSPASVASVASAAPSAEPSARPPRALPARPVASPRTKAYDPFGHQ